MGHQVIVRNVERAHNGPIRAQGLRNFELARERQGSVSRQSHLRVGGVTLIAVKNIVVRLRQARGQNLRETFRDPIEIGTRALIFKWKDQQGSHLRGAVEAPGA